VVHVYSDIVVHFFLCVCVTNFSHIAGFVFKILGGFGRKDNVHDVIHALWGCDDQGMDVMNTVDTVDYDDVAEGVRRFCAERLYELERHLRPLVDNSFGEILPGHLAGYVGALRQLGKLYQVEKAPRSLEQMMPMAKVQEIIAGIRAEHERVLTLAVEQAEARVRAELSSGQRLSIEAAKATVETKLAQLSSRAS